MSIQWNARPRSPTWAAPTSSATAPPTSRSRSAMPRAAGSAKPRIEGARLMPMREIPARVDELDGDKDVVAICHHGGRSQQVAVFLEKAGFKRIHNLAGGVDAWSRTVDPTVPVY